MTTTAERTLTGPRASSAVQCARMAVYQAIEAPREDPVHDMTGLFLRGRAWGQLVADRICQTFNEQGRLPRREVEIPWPAKDPVGVGHADIFVPHQRLIVEVVSNAGAKLPAHKPLQAALYALNHRSAERATVLAVDTHSGEEHAYPVDLDGLAPKVAEIEAQVVAGIRDGVLPDRPGVEGPWEAPCRWCEFSRHCWAGVELPEPEALPWFGRELRRLADLEDEGRGKEPEALGIKDRVRAVIEPGRAYAGGGVRVRIAAVEDTERFSLADMRSAGFSLPEQLQAFVKASGAHERWTIKREFEEER